MKTRKSQSRKPADAHEDIGAAFQGISKGLGEIMSRLGELGGELTRRFSTASSEPGERPYKAVYGFSITIGNPGAGSSGAAGQAGAAKAAGQGTRVKVEPFGNVSRNKEKDAEAPVHELREPLVDVFEEGDVFCIIAEMPGISEKDLQIEIEGDILTLAARAGDKHYRKEVLLPRPYKREGMTLVCNNGIVDIKLK